MPNKTSQQRRVALRPAALLAASTAVALSGMMLLSNANAVGKPDDPGKSGEAGQSSSSASASNSATSASSSSSSPSTVAEKVCPDLDTGHLSGTGSSMLITAPSGKVIVEVCVKAGSVLQGDGPEIASVDNKMSMTISHSSGKTISHYSVRFAPEPTPTSTPTPTVTPTETPTGTPTPTVTPPETPTGTPTPTVTPTETPTGTPTPTVTESVIVPPQLATVPETVTVPPQLATVPETVDVAVPPQLATIPMAANAGDGSSSPQSAAMALLLLIVGSLGALGAGLRLVANRVR